MKRAREAGRNDTVPELEIMMRELPIDEGQKRSVGDQTGAIDDNIEGAEFLMKDGDFAFNVGSPGQFALFE
jgi:hypothetical protein